MARVLALGSGIQVLCLVGMYAYVYVSMSICTCVCVAKNVIFFVLRCMCLHLNDHV